MVTFVLILLLAGHLLCMNVSSAAPLLCIWFADRKAVSGDSASREVAQQLAVWSVFLLVVGIAIGLIVGVLSTLTGDSRLVDTFPFFRRKIGWGVLELLCSLVWMLGYWAWLKWKTPQHIVTRFLHGVLALMAATNLLYHFPPLLTVMSRVACGEIAVTEEVDAAAFRSLFYTPNVLAHTLHFWWASIAVSGIFLFWLTRRSEDSRPFVLVGARVALAATALQLPTGLWLLFVTPPESQSRMVGGDSLATGLFVASLISAFYLLQNLATLALGEIEQNLPKRCGWLLLATVVMMTGTLHLLRAA